MKKIIKSLVILIFLTFGISNISFAQISKNVATTFINAHPAKDTQKVIVYTFSGYVNGEFIRDGEGFQASTTTIIAMDSCLHIKDGNGKEIYIPYSQIKFLGYQPETDEKYSSIFKL